MAADDPNSNTQKVLSQRLILARAYGSIAGSEATSGLAGMTYEVLVEQQLQRLVGGGGGTSAQDKIDRLVADLESVATALEEDPPEETVDAPVNTSP